MPAKAGIQKISENQKQKDWIPACAGMTEEDIRRRVRSVARE
jgi:hypothetical protein